MARGPLRRWREELVLIVGTVIVVLLLWIVFGILIAIAFAVLAPKDYEPGDYSVIDPVTRRRILAAHRREVGKHKAGR